MNAPPDYRGLAAIVIALALGGVLVIATIGLVWHKLPMGERGLNALIAIGGALSGGLAGYIGARHNNQ